MPHQSILLWYKDYFELQTKYLPKKKKKHGINSCVKVSPALSQKERKESNRKENNLYETETVPRWVCVSKPYKITFICRSLLEEEMETCSSILAWKSSRTEEPGGYGPWGLKGSDMTKRFSTHTLLASHVYLPFHKSPFPETRALLPSSLRPFSTIYHLC